MTKTSDMLKIYADNSKSPIFIIQDNKFIYINQAMKDVTGYSETELLSMNFWDLVHPDMKETVKERGQLRLKGEDPIPRYAIRLLHKSGESRWVDYIGERFVVSGKTSIYGTAMEIPEKKMAWDALIESEARYRDIIDNMEDGYYETDLSGNFTFFNRATTRILGYSEKEMASLNNRDYSNPETAKRIFHIYNMVYKTGKPSRIFDYEVIRKDKSKRILEVSASLIKDISGIPTGFRGVIRDKTSIKRTEQEKIALEKQLNQVLRMEAIGTLAGGIAHDFNNILTGIQGYISILKHKLADDKKSHTYLKLIQIDELVQSGADLTRQLLGFSMGGKYQVKAVDVNRIITKSLTIISRTNKKIIINKNLQNDLYAIDADAGQIEQVMINLYVNAAHAMSDGGHLNIESENIIIDLNSAKHLNIKPGWYVGVVVSDTGTGMDPKTMDKIFEPFFTTKEMGRGTGLGLASAYGIVKNHNGRIIVRSIENEGSRFIIYLPASNIKTVSGETPEHEKHAAPTGQETVLIIDGEERTPKAAEEIVRKIGYSSVITASTGKEGLDIYRADSEAIELVMLDMDMPEMGGEEILYELKKLNSDARVLMVNGYSAIDKAPRVANPGGGCIQKPFGERTLSAKIKEALL